jgi:hypothetical protein
MLLIMMHRLVLMVMMVRMKVFVKFVVQLTRVKVRWWLCVPMALMRPPHRVLLVVVEVIAALFSGLVLHLPMMLRRIRRTVQFACLAFPERINEGFRVSHGEHQVPDVLMATMDPHDGADASRFCRRI